jgi:class 3 adenylate cyclase
MMPEYLDLYQIFSRQESKDYLLKFPIVVTDAWENKVLVNDEPNIFTTIFTPIEINKKIYAKVKANKNDIPQITQYIKTQINFFIASTLQEHQLQSDLNLSLDISRLIDLSQLPKTTLHDVIQSFFHFLRSHIPFQQGSFYLENEKKQLILIGELMPDGSYKESPLLNAPAIPEETLVFQSYINQKAYIYDSLNQASDIVIDAVSAPIENIAVFPLQYDLFSIGAIKLTNSLQKVYSHKSVLTINKSLVGIGHIAFQDNIKKIIAKNEQTSDMFRSYVSQNVYESVVEGTNNDLNESEKREIVCLFCDIRSFTSISEKIDPETLVKLLNIYFSKLAPIIEEHEGTIDKFVGDMIMAFWNAPYDVKNAPIKAVTAAIKLQHAMVNKVVPSWLAEGVPHVGIGIGLHCGEAITGNIGSSGFNNYTAMGETVKKANWLESLARPGEIWVSEKLYAQVAGKVPTPIRKELNLQFHGKSQKAHVIKTVNYPDYTKG